MSETGYTYTTITAEPGEPTKVGVSFYLDGRALIGLTGAGSHLPFLSVMHGDVWVRICPRTEGFTDADARLARHLADEAARYASEVERLAQQAAGTRTA